MSHSPTNPKGSHETAQGDSAEPHGKGEGVLGGHWDISILMEVMGKGVGSLLHGAAKT